MMTLLAMAACLPVAEDRIEARHFGGAWPAFAALGGAAAGLAPAPGARRVFHFAELSRLAARHGLKPPAGEICFERPTRTLTRAAVLAAMQSAFPEARITVGEISRYPAPEGELVFPREGLRDGLWRGWVRYGGNRRFLVWACAEVRVRVRRVVAAGPLLPGRPIEAAQLREETAETVPSSTPWVAGVEEAIGRKPRRRIAAGAPLRLDLLEAPRQVERGDLVTVRVENGAAVLTLRAWAESAGNRGDAVRLRNPESNRLFTARIEGAGRAKVSR
ncbi:MAG: flagellar basal body P-ring formation chaperone FlgA [Bryobacteraceae bacterium]